MASVVREAQKGSYRHAELYFRLLGDLHQEPKSEGNTTINSLTFVMPMPSSIPQPAIPEHNGAEDHGVLDVPLVRDPEETVLSKFEVHVCPFCGDSFERLEMLGEHLIPIL